MPLALRAGAPGHPQRLLTELWERGNEFGLTPQAGGAPLGADGGVGTSWQLPLVALNFVLLPDPSPARGACRSPAVCACRGWFLRGLKFPRTEQITAGCS